MDIQLEDGRIAQFPDDATEDEVKGYLDRNFPKAPNVLERAAGHVSKGIATLAKDTSNLISYVDDSKSRTLTQMQDMFGDNKYTRQVEAHPETSLLGQAAAGIAEFAPQIPLFAVGEGVGMAAMRGIPLVRKIPAAIKAVKGENLLAGTVRAMGRGAVAGGVVGSVAGSPADTPIEEKLVEGGKEALGFAGATAVFHPAFAGLGMAGRAVLRRLGKKATPESVEIELEKKVARGDEGAAEDLQKIRLAKVETPVVEVKGEDDLYVPKGEDVKPIQGELSLEPLPPETLQKFADLGYTGKDIDGLPDKELIKILDNGIKNPSPSIEQLANMTSNLGKGIGAGEGQISIPAISEQPFGKKITTDVPAAGQPIRTHKRPGTILTLMKMGYQGGEIAKMSVDNAKIAIDKVRNAPEPSADVVAKAEAVAAKVDEVAKARRLMKVGEAEGKDRPALSDERKKEIDAEIDRELTEAETSPEPEPAIASIIDKLKERFIEDDTLDTLMEDVPKSKEEIILDWKLGISRIARDRALGIKREKASVEAKVEKKPPQTREELDALKKEINARGKERRKRGKLTQQEEADAWLKEHESELPPENIDEGQPKELDFETDEESTLYSDPTGIGHIINYISKKMKSNKKQEEAPSKTIEAEISGSKLYRSDEAHIDGLMSNIAKNINRFAQMKLESPDFAFRNNERMSPLIFNIHKKVYEGNFAASQRNEIIRTAETILGKLDNKEHIKGLLERDGIEIDIANIQKRLDTLTEKVKQGVELNKKEIKFLSKAPDSIARRTKTLSDIDSIIHTPNEIKAAELIRDELAAVREKYKDHLRSEYKKNLNEDEYAALSEIISGKPINEVIAKYKEHIVPDKLGRRRVRNWLNEEVVRDIAKDYAEIDSWGLDNYVTHVEKGHLRIVSEGKLYAKAMSEADAARKFADLVELHPNKNFRLETPSYEELATGLSKNAYNRVLFNLQEGLKDTIEGINSHSAHYLAQKGIKGRFFIKPTKEFSPYVLDRKEFLQGEKNVFDVLYGYMYSMERKMAIDPAIDDIRQAINKQEVVGTEAYTAKDGSIKQRDIKQSYLKQDEKEYLQELVEDIKGRYYAVDKAVDSIFAGSGYSRVFSKTVQGARELEANLKLGYAPVKGIINGLSGIGHIWTKTGTKYIADGAAFLRTEEGKSFIKAMEPYLGVNIVESASGELSSRGTLEKMLEKTGILGETGSMRRKAVHIAEPMGLFQAPEIPVRKLTLAANYLMAKADGVSEEAARDIAIKANWFQQFTYDMASLPKIMRGPVGRLVTQFKPYMLKEMEFISTLRGPEVARYIGMQLALAGPRGGIIVLKSLPVLGMMGVWDDIEEWMNKEYPVASRGVGGMAGVDVSAAATFQFPSTMKDWLGPTLSDIGSFYKNVVTPTIEKKGLDGSDLSKFTSSTFPILRYYDRLIEQAIDKDGWVKDERGRRLYHIDNTAAFVTKSVMGAEPIELNRIRTEERILATRSTRITDQKTMTIDNILEATTKGEPIAEGDLENMVKLGIKPGTLRRAAQFRVLDPKQRRLLQTELIRRPEIAEMYPEVGDLKE